MGRMVSGLSGSRSMLWMQNRASGLLFLDPCLKDKWQSNLLKIRAQRPWHELMISCLQVFEVFVIGTNQKWKTKMQRHADQNVSHTAFERVYDHPYLLSLAHCTGDIETDGTRAHVFRLESKWEGESVDRVESCSPMSTRSPSCHSVILIWLSCNCQVISSHIVLSNSQKRTQQAIR